MCIRSVIYNAGVLLELLLVLKDLFEELPLLPDECHQVQPEVLLQHILGRKMSKLVPPFGLNGRKDSLKRGGLALLLQRIKADEIEHNSPEPFLKYIPPLGQESKFLRPFAKARELSPRSSRNRRSGRTCRPHTGTT